MQYAGCLKSCAILVLLFAVLPGVHSFAQSSAVRSSVTQPTPVNLGFEQGETGEVPAGWLSPTVQFGYAARLTEENPKSGKRCAVLYSEANPTQFGNLMQAIDAVVYRGKRVRFKAAVRVEPSDQSARAQLWLRVDRKDQKAGFFDNMGDRPIRTPQWQYYDIVADIDEDATTINVGMILLGRGKAWLDDASVEDLGKLIVLAEPPRPLSGRGLENLIAFARLLGYARHFHPSDEAARANWERFAVDGMRVVEPAKDARELTEKLRGLFSPVAPTVRISLTAEQPTAPAELSLPDGTPPPRVVSWHHRGLGTGPQIPVYSSERVFTEMRDGKLPGNSPDPRKPFFADLGGGVSCLVPLALFADEKGTLPHSMSHQSKPESLSLVKYSGGDRGTRLADVALIWNVLQHFYPYFDVVKTDWLGALSDALRSAAMDADESAFLKTLRRLIAQLHDGHGGVGGPGDSGGYSIPILWGWIEGRLVVTDTESAAAADLHPGDIVLKIDGRSSEERLAEAESLISSATPQWRRYNALTALKRGSKDSEVKLYIQTQSGENRTVTLRRSVEFGAIEETRPPKVSEVKPGVFYLDLDRITDQDFQAALPSLEKARGIIFDLRGYPKVSPVVIQHLIDKPVNSARWNIPIVTAPDHAITEFDTSGRWELQPRAPRLKAKIAFITDGRAISYAESYLGIIEAYKLADIVGEPTAGTNGNVNPIKLPGGYIVYWTGMKVLKHDGSRHHGVGILPTVPVSRTIRGVAQKRDEQLEKSIALVSQ